VRAGVATLEPGSRAPDNRAVSRSPHGSGVDLVRLGLGIRALRRRRRWRQIDLARAAGVSQALVSLVERGHCDRVSIRTLLAVAAALDSRLTLQIRWRAGDLDRLLDADALVAGAMVQRLHAAGWETRVEVTYASVRTAGSIDILAWHAPTRSLLVIEVKTEITSAEATLRKLDEKGRVAAVVAMERFGWCAAAVSRVLIGEDTSTNRRRLRVHDALFVSSLPLGGTGVRRWLLDPVGAVAGHMFLSLSNGGTGIHKAGGRHRVRRPAQPLEFPEPSLARDKFPTDDEPDQPIPTILVG
jgi:transcriptional regulator with XRE-family HTH domain